MRRQNGITLIALIITIIVMLILVGVTVNVAINGGLIDVTKESKFKTQVRQIQEALQVKKVTLAATNGGELPEAVSITLDDLDMEEGLKDAFGEKLTIEKTEDDLVLKYTSNVTAQEEEWLIELGIEGEEVETPGEEPFVDDFDIAIDKTMFYYSDIGNHIIGVRLEVNTDITNKWGCPEYTVETALPIVVENMKDEEIIANDDVINTLGELDLRIYNIMRMNDDDENPLYGAPEANVFYIEDKESADDVSVQEVINSFIDAGGLPEEYRNATAEMFYEVINGNTVEEEAASLYYYTPETKSVKIGQSVEELMEIPTSDCHWIGYKVWFDVRTNGTYIIELEFDGKKSRETIEINEIYVEKTEEELLQETIQEVYNTETGKVDFNILSDRLSEDYTTELNSNNNILKLTKNDDGMQYVVTEQGRMEKAILTAQEVLEKLQITQTGDKYAGEWEVIGTDGDKLKYVSKINVVSSYALGYADPKALEAIPTAPEGGPTSPEGINRAIWSYNNAITTLNAVAEEATGIVGARSIALQDIYNIIGEENINKGTDFGIAYKYYHVNNVDAPKMQYQTGVDDEGNIIWSAEQNTTSGVFAHSFIEENGEIFVLDAIGEEKIVNNNAFEYVFTQPQLLGSLRYDRFWLADRYQKCQKTGVTYGIYFIDGIMKSTQIQTMGYGEIFQSKGYGDMDLTGVRAVITL